ncbi:MAG: GNAT family N-acetyltransferase [Phycisphaerae bacterium]
MSVDRPTTGQTPPLISRSASDGDRPIKVGRPSGTGPLSALLPTVSRSLSDSHPVPSHRVRQTCLTPFDLLYAPDVAMWVPSAAELAFLAPGTAWPLTARKVAAWGRHREARYLFWIGGDNAPAGYAELDFMPGRRDQMWIGHVVVAPARRGRSYGFAFIETLFKLAFDIRGVSAVLLVVLPDNDAAIRCYRRAGMTDMGFERKFFRSTGQSCSFLRMGIDKNHYLKCVRRGRLSGRCLPIRPQASDVW